MITSIQNKLSAGHPWKESILYFDTIESTNTTAKELAAQGAPEGTVLIADRQTGGRGRMGRSFHSPSGTGIYFSLILRPACPASRLMHLTCAVATAVCDAVEKSCSARPGIKWTNDLVWGSKKLGGILTELMLDTKGNAAGAVIGIGINCNQSDGDFPEEIRQIASSLRAMTGSPVDRSSIIAAMLESLETMSRQLLTQKDSILDHYRRDCVTLGKHISILTPTAVRHGIAKNIDADGSLVVEFPDGHLEAVSSGEVSIRGMYGYI